MNWAIEALCAGKPAPFNGVEKSAIAKQPVAGPVRILSEGFECDEQADRKVHGGPDMAVHLYPLDHHDFWNGMLMGHPLLDDPGAFGSNLAVRGIGEKDVCIGDRFRLGTALLEISQPRQPCWKIEHRFQTKGMVKAIIENHNCGWYFRVIEEGEAQAGDALERIERGHVDWSVAHLFAKLYDPKHKASIDELREIASLEKLCTLWRTKVAEAIEG